MGDDWLFRKAIFLIGSVSSIPYATWPLFISSALIFLINKFKPITLWQPTLITIWWAITIFTIALVASLVIAYFAVPEIDQVAHTVMYLSLIASIPIIVSCVIVIFCKPVHI
jgi:hypothetical protein